MTTLDNIENKIRLMTARKSNASLSQSEIYFQVNNYYLYEFPLQFRTLDLRSEYQFITDPNVDVYNVSPNTFTSFEPTAYVAGYPTIFVEDRTLFHKLFPDVRNDVLVLLADGRPFNQSYTGFITSTPLLKGSVLVYAQVSFSEAVKVVDDSNGNLVDLNTDGSFGTIRGVVDYQTGQIIVTFPLVVPSGNEIRAQSRQYNANRPTTVFYWDNQITLRPVPDRSYSVRLVGYLLPTQLLSGTSQPPLAEWWEALAYGAASKIYENNKDFNGRDQMRALLEEKLDFLGRREWYYLRSQRTPTIYNSPAVGSNPGFYSGFFGTYW